MSALPTIRLRQARGQWIATPADAHSAQVLGAERCAVLRDFRDGKWSWRGTPTLADQTPIPGAGTWWMLPRHEAWRSLLKPGAAVALRWATSATPDAPSGSVGAWIGLFQLGSILLAPQRMHLALTDRIAEIAP